MSETVQAGEGLAVTEDPVPAPVPEPDVMAVRLANGTHGGVPGQVIAVSAALGRQLVREGLATRAEVRLPDWTGKAGR